MITEGNPTKKKDDEDGGGIVLAQAVPLAPLAEVEPPIVEAWTVNLPRPESFRVITRVWLFIASIGLLIVWVTKPVCASRCDNIDFTTTTAEDVMTEFYKCTNASVPVCHRDDLWASLGWTFCIVALLIGTAV
jgi:hypothetical protein